MPFCFLSSSIYGDYNNMRKTKLTIKDEKDIIVLYDRFYAISNIALKYHTAYERIIKILKKYGREVIFKRKIEEVVLWKK